MLSHIAGVFLGQLPNPSLLSQVPLMGNTPVVSSVTTPILSLGNTNEQVGSSGITAPCTGPIVVSSALPPIPGKLVQKILTGAFVEMRELLPDNLMLRRQLEIQDEFSAMSPHTAKPPLREVQSISSWVCCMASYYMVLASAGKLRPEHLSYLRIVVAEAAKYKSDGWRSYDAIFRQNMAAGAHGIAWAQVDSGLHAVTFQATRNTLSCCTICFEPDHSAQDCALQATINVKGRGQAVGKTAHRSAGGGGRSTPYTQLCYSWNNGACLKHPAPCRFEHLCAKCIKSGHRRAHRAVECRAITGESSGTGGRAGNQTPQPARP